MYRMNRLVKILADNNGEEIEKEFQFWCLVQNIRGSETVCSGQFFGFGESAVIYEERIANKGGITCPNCLKRIQWFKDIKL